MVSTAHYVLRKQEDMFYLHRVYFLCCYMLKRSNIIVKLIRKRNNDKLKEIKNSQYRTSYITEARSHVLFTSCFFLL